MAKTDPLVSPTIRNAYRNLMDAFLTPLGMIPFAIQLSNVGKLNGKNPLLELVLFRRGGCPG